ncbi:unnamed protein product, partial [Brenthis ino]
MRARILGQYSLSCRTMFCGLGVAWGGGQVRLVMEEFRLRPGSGMQHTRTRSAWGEGALHRVAQSAAATVNGGIE